MNIREHLNGEPELRIDDTVTADETLKIPDNPYLGTNTFVYHRCTKAWEEGFDACMDMLKPLFLDMIDYHKETAEALEKIFSRGGAKRGS